MRILPLLLLLVVADLVCAGNRKLVVTQSQVQEVKINDDGADENNHHSIPRGAWGSQNPHEVGDPGQDNEGSSGNHN